MLIRAYRRHRGRIGVHLRRRLAAGVTAVCFAVPGALIAHEPLNASAAGPLSLQSEVVWNMPTTMTSPTFSTTVPNELVVAYYDGSYSPSQPLVTISGAGLTWHQAVNESVIWNGEAAIWWALAPSILTGQSVSASNLEGGGEFWVEGFTGIDTVTPIGGTGVNTNSAGPATVSCTTTKNNGWVWSTARTDDGGNVLTPGGGQAFVDTFSYSFDEDFVARTTAATPGSGTPVTESATVVPANWSMACAEIRPAGASAPAADFGVATHTPVNFAATSETTPPISSSQPNQVFVGFFGTNSTTPAPNPITSVTGGGLTWVFSVAATAQYNGAEVWYALAPSVVTNMQVTYNFGTGTLGGQAVITAWTGIDMTTPIGAKGSANATSGAPTKTLTTTRANSWVWAVGADWDSATAHTVGAAQTMDNQTLEVAGGDGYWVQKMTTTTPVSGTAVTINDTAVPSERWDFSAVELLPATCPISAAGTCAASQTFTESIGAGSLSVTAPANATLAAQNPATTTAALPMGAMTFANTLNDGVAWSVTLAATDFGAAKIPFTNLAIGVTTAGNYSPQAGNVGTPTAGAASQTLAGADGSPGTTFSTAITLASAAGGNTVDGTWTTPAGGTGNTITEIVPGNTTAGTYTSTFQYTITG